MTPDAAPHLNHVRAGAGAPVLLVHPAGLELTHWGAQIDALRHAHEVIAYDLAGHGLSPAGAEDMSFARHVADAAVLLDLMGADAVHMVGISYGSMIAQHFALTHPSRLLSLTLIGSAAAFPDVARAGMRDRARRLREGGMAAVLDETKARWFTETTCRDRPDLIDRAIKTLLGDDPEVHAQVWETVASHDTESRLSEIACPTLVLAGADDPSTPPAAARRLQQGVAGARLAILSGASHMVTLEQPALVNAHLASFLAEFA